ncbi:D-alanine--D-alanine ligase [mine drainage metagenome]|uniref:D-alanine--D-alanine ligase n=1 Tax=mine drainage metagenome TaxID=410659 RepID=A0A1J5PTJ2_9ZZZZ
MTTTRRSRKHVVAFVWDERSLSTLLEAGDLQVTVVLDAWESQNRDMKPAILDKIRALHVVTSYTDLTSLAALGVRLRAETPAVQAVISLGEYSQLGAAYLASVIGLPEPSIATSVLVRDKSAMKAAARRGGIPCAKQQVLYDRDEAALETMGADLGWPVVIKPIHGMGTVDTWVVDSARQAAELLCGVSSDTTIVVEEYIDGDEYHVDAVWVDSKPVDFGIGRYAIPRIQITDPGHLNGSAHLREAEHRELYDALRPLSIAVNAAMGITSGITHAEFFHTPDGRWIFSEIATRPGGAGTTKVFGFFGDDLRVRWLTSVFADPARVCREEPVYAAFGWANFAPSRVGRVTAAPDEAILRKFPFVEDVIVGHQAGDVMREVHPSTWSWLVFFGADSFEEYVDRLLEVEKVALFSVEDERPVV